MVVYNAYPDTCPFFAAMIPSSFVQCFNRRRQAIPSIRFPHKSSWSNTLIFFPPPPNSQVLPLGRGINKLGSCSMSRPRNEGNKFAVIKRKRTLIEVTWCLPEKPSMIIWSDELTISSLDPIFLNDCIRVTEQYHLPTLDKILNVPASRLLTVEVFWNCSEIRWTVRGNVPRARRISGRSTSLTVKDPGSCRRFVMLITPSC